MRNTINRTPVTKKRLFFFMMATMFATALSAGTVNYTADDVSIFTNPERGFITMLERKGNKTRYAVKGKESYLTNLKTNDKGTLVLVLYYLDEFKNVETLPDSMLTAFDEDMAVLREYGMKCILRYAYTNSDAGEIGYDASLSIVQKHIDQYKSHWEANTDVIFCFQAGFVGSWGEWYYSSNFGNKESHMNESRTAFLDTLLNATPKNRCVQIRTPRFKEEYISGIRNGHPAALDADEAYSDTKKARLGHHNDAFLYHYDNMGTYSDTSIQKPYIAQETLYVPIGGESDITEQAQAETEASYENTIAEMSRLHWTFIQSGFSKTVTDMWRANGTFDTLNVHMGYRFQLVNGTYSEAVTAGNNLSVNMNIKNVGYAPLYNERHAYIVLKNENAAYALKLTDIDPRTWKPNGVISTINENVIVPDTALNGTYDLYLWLPDAYESLQNDARYAVRFANNGVWEESSGMNALGAQVVVSGGSDAPDTSIHLPATLNKANVGSYSADMTWYGANDEYFDFGPTDAPNLDRWAEWNVNLVYPGEYIVTEVFDVPGSTGHEWQFVLLDSKNDTISTYNTTREWKPGRERTESAHWDLKAIPIGKYYLRIRNAFSHAQPKLKSLTLEYDGDIPSGIDETVELEPDAQPYDILGRPVDDSYHGIVIMRGKKILR